VEPAQTEQRQQGAPTVQELEHRLAFERLVMSVSTRFINSSAGDIDAGIERSLSAIGTFCDVDRAYLFALRGSTLWNTHEWCGAGVEPQIHNLQDLPAEIFGFTMERLRRRETIHVPFVDELPEEAAPEREMLRMQDIQSIVLVPLFLADQMLGFIGFDSVKKRRTWTGEDIALLQIAGEIFVNALERQRADGQRRTLEEQLVQARSMENVARLAGGVAHDFNNLLSVITSHARVIARDVADSRLRRSAEVLCQSAEQAAELTRQLMIVGRRELVPAEVLDPNQILRSLATLLEHTLEGVQFSLEPCEGPCFVRLGRAHLKQIVVNLVVNARDALRGPGRVHVSTACVARAGSAPLGAEADAGGAADATAEGSSAWLRLRVSDDGVGMVDEVKSRAFEPFFSTKGALGTGLGLATVHGIVTQAGGRVEIDSAPGQGTRVDVYLPCVAPAPEVSAAAPQAEAARGRGELILLVEDSAPLRCLLGDLLVEHGYRVLSAALPALALEMASRADEPIALLLTDVILPSMTGRELAEELRKRCEGLAVAYISGHDNRVLVRRGVLEEGILLLPKPFADAELLGFVRLAIDGASA
jgi:signal transduction histidine kinase